MKTTSTLAIAAALLLAPSTSAFSQATTAPGTQPMVPIPQSDTMERPSNRPGDATLRTTQSATVRFLQIQDVETIRGSNLIGAKVMSSANEDIGDVNDVLFDMQGRGIAVVVGVGGFLGLGEKNVAVPFERLSMARNGKRADDIVISLETTRDELNAAPEFRMLDDDMTGSTTTEGIVPIPRSETGPDGQRNHMTPPAAGTQSTAPAVQ